MHSSTGKVTSIDEHHNGKHATVTVTHGKRKRAKGDKNQPGELMGYDRPTSRITLSKADAANYSLGQRVNAGIAPGENDDDEDADDSGEASTANAAPPVPKKKAAPTPAPKGHGPIFGAMTKKPRGKK